MFDWMAWTTPVAVFFVCIVLMLIGMTVWEIRSPTALRKGFLPIATTRGDRLFIGLLSAAYLNLIFFPRPPPALRRGFLPIATTRGDRLFIGLLSAAYVNLIFVGLSGRIAQWLGLAGEPSVWFGFVASMALLVLVMRKG